MLADLWGLFANAFFQGLCYYAAVLGIAFSFRIIRYPDLTSDGSFLLGGVTFAALSLANHHWIVCLLAAGIIGALAGLLTASLHSILGIPALLTGIITTMVAYSVAFRILNGSSNVRIERDSLWATPPFLLLTHLSGESRQVIVIGLVAASLGAFVYWVLRSETGLLFRAAGANPSLLEDFGHNPDTLRKVGLMAANALTGIAGGIVSAQQGFADISLGFGITISLLASLLIGEHLLAFMSRSYDLLGLVLQPIVGSVLYYAITLVILRASLMRLFPLALQPTDLKLISAVVFMVLLALRTRKHGMEEVLPL